MLKEKTRIKKPTLKPIISRDKATIKILEQSGKTPNLKIDRSKYARLPGKRYSRSGKVYWETRKNRSDAPFKRI